MFHPDPEMKKALNGNGKANGNGAGDMLRSPAKPISQSKTNRTAPEFEQSQVSLETVDGVELRGTPVRINRHQIVFEVYGPAVSVRLSEAWPRFQVTLQGQMIYSGRAVLRHLVDAGTKTVYEVALDESQWIAFDFDSALQEGGSIAKEFGAFLKEWQKCYVISPEFKVAVADMQTFLHDLRLWLDRVESRIPSLSESQASPVGTDLSYKIGEDTTPALTTMFEKLEAITNRIDSDQAGIHAAFARRMLHPLLLCSPFLHRTYYKPLGYAGDYEMVNMMFRDPVQGETLFAKIINLWFLQQPPAQAHRNRITYLLHKLDETALRTLKAGKPARILSIGCGPAVEVQRFMAQKFLAEHVQFTLIDFNQETLNYTRQILDGIRNRYDGRISVQYVKKSVDGILREGSRRGAAPIGDYDFVYCAGLFDYLADPICQRLMDIMYDWVSPKGLLLATNVGTTNPRKPTMDYVMDWHLIYRSARDLSLLKPGNAQPEDCTVKADETGVNVFIEVRKPSQ